ncbi:MAG TPA: pilin [bacterium]|nr:pilin [bacterium]
MQTKHAKKILYPALLGYQIMAFALPTFALSSPVGETSFMELLDTLISFMLSFIGVIAVIYLIWMGFKYVTAGGDSKKAGEAKEGITHAIIGIAIALLGYVLVKFIFTTLGAEGDVTQYFDE